MYALAAQLHCHVADVRAMSWRDYTGWLQFFHEAHTEAGQQETGPPVDLADVSPEQAEGLFG